MKRNSKSNTSPNKNIQQNQKTQNKQAQNNQKLQKQKTLESQKPQQQQQQQQPKKVIKNGYEFLSVIGSGAFGTVYKVQKNGQFFAIKQLTIKKSPRYMQYVYNEIEVMKKLNSKNCVKCYETWEEQNFIFIVMELCDLGTLYTYIVTKQPNEKQCLKIFVQLLRGFQELHEKQILHRDLKPQNIFIQSPDIFKIADFGVAKPLDLGKSCVGTPYFMSPEIQKKLPHNYKTDLWSLGVILYFMLFKCYPFKGSKKLIVEIYQKTNPFFDVKKVNPQSGHKISKAMADLLKRILVWDVSQRISFQEVYELDIIRPFFQEEEIKQSKIKYDLMEKSLKSESTQQQNSFQNLNQSNIKGNQLLGSQVGKNNNNNFNNNQNNLNNSQMNKQQNMIQSEQRKVDMLMNQTMKDSIIVENNNNTMNNLKSQIQDKNNMTIQEEKQLYEEEQEKQKQELEQIRIKNLQLQQQIEQEKQKERKLQEEYKQKLKQKNKEFEDASEDLHITSNQIYQEEKKNKSVKYYSVLVNQQFSSIVQPSTENSNNPNNIDLKSGDYSKRIGPQLKIEEILSKQSDQDLGGYIEEIDDFEYEDNNQKDINDAKNYIESLEVQSMGTQQQHTFQNLNVNSANDLETFNPQKQQYQVCDTQSDKLSQQLNTYMQSGLNNSNFINKNGSTMLHLNQNYYANVYANIEQDSYRNNSEKSNGTVATAGFGQKLSSSTSQVFNNSNQNSQSNNDFNLSKIKDSQTQKQNEFTINNFSIIQEESSNNKTIQSNFSKKNSSSDKSKQGGLNPTNLINGQNMVNSEYKMGVEGEEDIIDEEEDQNQLNQAIKQQEMFKSQIRNLQNSMMVNTTFNGTGGQNLNDQKILFKEQIEIISQEREKIMIIGGTIEELEILQFQEWQQNLVAYALIKLLTILASNVKNTIKNPKNNVYNLKNIEHFSKSQIAKNIVEEFQKDIDQWNTKFLLYFFSIDPSEIQENKTNKEKIFQFLDDNNGDRLLLTFEDIKIPMRLILDPIFKTCYKLGNDKNNTQQKKVKLLRVSLMLLLCMLVNNYFKPSMLQTRFKLYFKENKEWDMSNFITWIKTANFQDLLDQIHDVIKVAFGQEALNRLKNSV